MALRFYDRCEAANLNTGAGDASTGDTTAQGLGTTPTFSATAAKTGTNGMLCVGGAQSAIGFSLLSVGEIIEGVVADGSTAESAIVFSAGWWVNFRSSGAIGLVTGADHGLRLNGDGSNHVALECAGTSTLRLAIRATSRSDKFATLTTSLSANTWYGVVIRLDAAANKFALELYDASAALIEAVEVTSQTLGAQMPWFTSTSTGLQFGTITSRAQDVWFDNLIISDVYAAPIAANLAITNASQYSESGGVTRKLKMLAHSDAQSKTGVAGVVFEAPDGSDITGVKIGEFTGAAFSGTLESGQAVLKVAVADFGGGGLATSDQPRVHFRYDDAGTLKGCGIAAATVIDE